MDLNHKIIAIAGNARAGKDTLGNNFKKLLFDQGIKSNTYSFADELKKSVDAFLLEQLGISAFSEDPEEKKIIRPFLVFWGTDIMRSINNNVWVDKLTDTLPDNEVCIVTDLRFSNELDWVKNNNGTSILIKRDGIEPANNSESLNNKELEAGVDSVFHIADVEDENILMLTANEILNSITNKKTYNIWKATCHL